MQRIITVKKAASLALLIAAYLTVAFSLTGCSSSPSLKTYTPQQAIENGDVVDVHGQVTNLEKLENFMISVDHGTVSTLKITSYTTEGDPIFKVLEYDGKIITSRTDNSLDKFAGPVKGVTYSSFTKIIKGTQSPVSYYLVDSNGNKQFLLTVTKMLPIAPMDDITADQPGYSSKYPRLDITSGSIKINWVRGTANYTSKPNVMIGNSNFGIEMDDALALPGDIIKPGSRINFKAAEVSGLEKPTYSVRLMDRNKQLTDYPSSQNSIIAPTDIGDYLFELEVKWGNENHQIFYWFKVSTYEAANQIGYKLIGNLPTGWDIYQTGDKAGQILKDGKVVGQIEIIGYYGEPAMIPNHSSINSTENIMSGLGKGKIYILDRSTPAASPEQKTWTEIYAMIPISNQNLAFGISIETDNTSLQNDRNSMDVILNKLALKPVQPSQNDTAKRVEQLQQGSNDLANKIRDLQAKTQPE